MQRHQRETEDDVRHHQRCSDQGAEQRLAAEALEAGHHHRRQRAQHGGGTGGPERHHQAGPHRIHQRAVGEQVAVGTGGEPGPDHRQPRAVERIEHQQQDRQVQEGEAEQQHAQPQALGGARAHACFPSSRRCWERLNSRIGTSSSRIIATAIAEAPGQLRLLKNSFHSWRPTISVSEPPSISGITNSPIAGIITSMQPAMMPAFDSGRVMRRNACHGLAPRS
ncbi:hypothetical protein G6F62_013592 [Rhizopus arrhizus]|nr:hypothetical protein G6F62_013592 [Rhizopus arrhizus]